jgi:hypothetical protein
MVVRIHPPERETFHGRQEAYWIAYRSRTAGAVEAGFDSCACHQHRTVAEQQGAPFGRVRSQVQSLSVRREIWL